MNIYVIKSELGRYIQEIKAYLLNYVFNNINTMFMVIGLLVGMSFADKTANQTTVFVYGLVIWYATVSSIQTLSSMVQEEIRVGTLEQLLITKTKISTVFFTRMLITTIIDLIIFMVVAMFSVIITENKFDFTSIFNIKIIISICITLIGTSGLGFIAAGASLIYKKSGAVTRLTTYLVLFFSGLIIPLSELPVIFGSFAKLFPFYYANVAIESIQYGSAIDTQVFLVVKLLSISFIWYICGIIIFNSSLKTMIKKGSTGHY